MRTIDRYFYKSTTTFCTADGVEWLADVYTYESRDHLYDVVVIDDRRFVRTDMGPISNLISEWRPHHYAIERHFGLEEGA